MPNPPKTIKTKLVKLSICPCGFPLLQDGIALGTEYLVFPDSIDVAKSFTLICGGCGQRTQGKGSIAALSVTNPLAPPWHLPLEIFDIATP